MNTVVAIPSTHPVGLEAPLGAHFGHCDLYLTATWTDDNIRCVVGPFVDSRLKMAQWTTGLLGSVGWSELASSV